MPKVLTDIRAVLVDDLLDEIKVAVDLANNGTALPISTVEIVLKMNATFSGGIDFTIPLVSSITGKFVGKTNHITETHLVFEPKPVKGAYQSTASTRSCNFHPVH
jgi:hypothetical protein